MEFLSLSESGVIGIAVGAALLVVVGIVIAVIAVRRSQMKKRASAVCINPEHDNTKLLERIKVENAAVGTTVIVPPTHAAVVLKNGNLTGIYSSGEFVLVSRGEIVHSLEILFISVTLWVPVMWGTQEHNRFDYVDPKIGMPVSVGAFGEMKIRVTNPRLFYLELVASFGDVYSVDDLQASIRKNTIDATVRELQSVLTKNRLSYFDFNGAKYDIQEQIRFTLSSRFDKDFGFEVRDFIIENINIPTEQEKEIRRVYELSDRQNELYELERRDTRKRKRDAVEDFDLDDELYRKKTARLRDEREFERSERAAEAEERRLDQDRLWTHEEKMHQSESEKEDKVIDIVRDIEVARAKAQTPVTSKVEVSVTSKTENGDGIICPSCHSKLPSGTAYCNFCGARIKK